MNQPFLLDITDLFNGQEINAALAGRYLLNITAILILVRIIYYRNYRRTDLFLTFFGFNTIIFLVAYLLNKVEMTTGAAFGLFAVFSILRYRTEGISAKDMTYLFLCIAIGLLTAVSKGSIAEQAVCCCIILLLTQILESNWLTRRENSRSIIYDSLSNIHEEKKAVLLQELIQKTGLEIHRFEITETDFIKDSCRITVYYYEQKNKVKNT